MQAHTLLFLLVYALILILPYTKWRDRLPAKPSFYRYIVVLVVVNVLAALGERTALLCGEALRHALLPELYAYDSAADRLSRRSLHASRQSTLLMRVCLMQGQSCWAPRSKLVTVCMAWPASCTIASTLRYVPFGISYLCCI